MIMMQLGIMIFLTVVVQLYDRNMISPVVIACSLVVLKSGIFSIFAFKSKGACGAQSIVSGFFWGEVAKYVITVMGVMALVKLKQFHAMQWLFFLAAILLMQLSLFCLSVCKACLLNPGRCKIRSSPSGNSVMNI